MLYQIPVKDDISSDTLVSDGWGGTSVEGWGGLG